MMKMRKYLIVLVLCCIAGKLHSQYEILHYPVQVEKELQTSEYLTRYLLFLPENYNSEKNWPVLLFLHGSGERGDNLELVKKHGPPKLAFELNLPFIIVSPQCMAGKRWETKPLIELMEHILSEHPADRQRIYLTGLSMGAFGTWELASAYPDFFAAVVPVCGGGNPDDACNLWNTPVWVFHGDGDEIVPPERSREMVNALKDCNGKVKFTIYPETGHDSWTRTYANPKLYNWLLNHSLSK